MSKEQKNLFGQVLVALVTPMTAEGEVDWAATEKHIDYVISNGGYHHHMAMNIWQWPNAVGICAANSI